jgi:nitrite reductase (NADH) small subunit
VSESTFVDVAAAADLGPGASLAVEVAGREIALWNVGGAYYALENYCPHQGAPLVDGWVDGTTVTCSWHAWCFNLTDGTMTMGAFAKADAYDVKVEGGRLLVSNTPRAAAS